MQPQHRAFAIEQRAQRNPIPPADRQWLRRNAPRRAARIEAGRVAMPECDYATLASVNSFEKPVVVADLPALARRVHRLRRGAPIQCVNAVLESRDAEPRACVNVYELDDTGARTRLVCHAFVRGRQAPTLMAALETAQPQTPLAFQVREL